MVLRGAYAGNFRMGCDVDFRPGHRELVFNHCFQKDFAVIWKLFISTVFAAESWLCSTQSSKIVGDHVKACGVGHGINEDQARSSAFDSAQIEFKKLCKISSSCRDHKVTVDPKRTTCDQVGKKWKCYRLLEFTIQDEKTETAVAEQSTKDLGIIWSGILMVK